MFGLIAKGHAAAGQSVIFLSIHAMLHFIEHDAERRTELAKIRHLFLDGFEKDFAQDGGCPYTYYQQIEVEEFIRGRRDAGLVTNFSTHNKWDAVKWWSRDFIAAQGEAVVKIGL